MKRDEYREVYLRSDHWREQRTAALARAGNRCQVCNSSKRLDVHHRTYERLGREEPGDLTVLCRACHELFHADSKPVSVTKLHPKADVGTGKGRNWSEMDVRAQVRCRDHVLSYLVAKGGSARPGEIATATGYKTQAVGTCLVGQRRNGLVERHKGRWHFTAKGRVMFGLGRREAA